MKVRTGGSHLFLGMRALRGCPASVGRRDCVALLEPGARTSAICCAGQSSGLTASGPWRAIAMSCRVGALAVGQPLVELCLVTWLPQARGVRDPPRSWTGARSLSKAALNGVGGTRERSSKAGREPV